MSTLKVATIADTGGSNGSTPAEIVNGRCKAWVSYNQKTPAVLDSYGVSSIGDNGAGRFTVNFSTNWANTNYVMTGVTNRESQTGDAVPIVLGNSYQEWSTSQARVCTGWQPNGGLYDCERNCVAFFGEQ